LRLPLVNLLGPEITHAEEIGEDEIVLT